MSVATSYSMTLMEHVLSQRYSSMRFFFVMTFQRSTQMSKDEVMQNRSWEFNEEVSEVFSDMLSRSIPDYDNMRDLMFRMAKNFVTPYSNVLDIGCSTGLSAKGLIECKEAEKTDFMLIDISEPMIRKCRELYEDRKNVDVLQWDITEGCPVCRCSVIISCLTLQFVPIEYRQKIISSIYDSLNKGGALFLVEKVIGNSHTIDKVMVGDKIYNCAII